MAPAAPPPPFLRQNVAVRRFGAFPASFVVLHLLRAPPAPFPRAVPAVSPRAVCAGLHAPSPMPSPRTISPRAVSVARGEMARTARQIWRGKTARTTRGKTARTARGETAWITRGEMARTARGETAAAAATGKSRAAAAPGAGRKFPALLGLARKIVSSNTEKKNKFFSR